MLISVTVKPGSKKGPLVERQNVSGENSPETPEYTVFLREKPHDGEANVALIKLLAEFFNVPKTSIRIKSGLSSRKKLIELPL